MKVRASDWVKEIFDNYKHIPMKDVTREALYELITKDSGVNMVRKAKEAIGVLQNTLNPAWKDPDAFASGTQLGGALTVCKQVAWIRNEEDKKKVAGKKGIEYAIRPFDERMVILSLLRTTSRQVRQFYFYILLIHSFSTHQCKCN